VSHNLAAVTSLCGKVVYLHAGRVRGVGPSERLAGQYLIDLQAGGAKRSTDARRVGDALDVEACEVSPNPTPSGGTVALRVAFSARRETHLRELALLVHQGGTGVRTAVIDFRGHGVPATIAAGEPWEIRGEIRSLPFVEGNYGIGVYVATEAVSQDVPDLSSLSVSPRAVPGQLPSYPAVHRGIVELDFRLTSCTTTTHAS
jgi:lipopolysaccharide transport system ATP-binding protein